MGCGVSTQPNDQHTAHQPSFYTYESSLTTDIPDLRDSVGNLPHASIQYGLWFPQCYGSTNPNLNKKYHECSATTDGPKLPLLLYLHGAGGRDLREPGKPLLPFTMERLWTEYPNPLNLSGDPNYPFVLMIPHCPLGQEWAKKLMAFHVTQAVLDVAQKHNIDIGQIYVTGKSMGGEGSWKVAAACPELWAACVPMCGGMWPYGGVGAAEYGHLITMPTWVFHAEPDGHVHIKESEIAVEAVSKVNAHVKFTRYETAPDVNGHDCWTRGYSDPALIKWLSERENSELRDKGLTWVRQKMEEQLVHGSARKIQQKAVEDPFAFKRGLRHAFVSKLTKKK